MCTYTVLNFSQNTQVRVSEPGPFARRRVQVLVVIGIPTAPSPACIPALEGYEWIAAVCVHEVLQTWADLLELLASALH